MLVEFSVANFRSIHARQTLSLVAGPGREHLQRNVISRPGEGPRLLRSAVIYGPNAAGKSNLLRALATLQQLVLRSASQFQQGERLPVSPFVLSAAAAQQPSEFELIFIADDVRYHYGCAVAPQRVFREWLTAYPHGRAQRWFEREYQAGKDTYDWWFGPNFRSERAERKVWQDFTRANALFLSTAVQLNNAQLRPVFNWVEQKLIVLPTGIEFNPFLSLELLQQNDGQAQIMRYLNAADVGIDRLELLEEDIPPTDPAALGPLAPGAVRINVEVGHPAGLPALSRKRFRVLAWHRRPDSGDEVPLDLNDESDGTKKLFEFIGGWIRALEIGATLFVDELDRSLHPHMTRFLVDLFHGQSNTRDAQLVFTTHDTTLLDSALLRRDQIWFVEKDKHHASRLYSLLDYQPRKDEALERGYLKGRYRAVPVIGSVGH